MAPPSGRLGRGVKLPVQVRLCPEAIAAVDAFAAELSQQRDGAAFRRAEALRMAALAWRKARQARRASGPISPSLSEPEAARVVTETVTTRASAVPSCRPGSGRAASARGRRCGRGGRHGGHARATKAPRACPCRALTTAPVGDHGHRGAECSFARIVKRQSSSPA